VSSAFTYDGIGHNLVIKDSAHAGSFSAEGVSTLDVTGGTYSARILAGVDCYSQFDCRTGGSSGSLMITIDGPNATSLDSASAKATHKLLRGDGSTAGQADAPVIFTDQAANHWIAPVAETPLSKQSQPDATIMSFAVANLSSSAQAVTAKVFDAAGKLVGSATTPVLNGASSLGSPFEGANGGGGVYAVTLSGLLGIDLIPSSGDTVFHGTVTFEGTAGGKIAPLVVQMNWPSITSIPVKPE
jgi:hypothetical protein